MSSHLFELYFDGASKGNPGPSGAGWALYLDGHLIAFGKSFLGRKTNNQAEYLALLNGLQEIENAKRNHAITNARLIIKGDSELIIRQLEGRYRVKNPQLRPLYQKIMELLAKQDDWKCQWIPRHENDLADSLANQAISDAISK